MEAGLENIWQQLPAELVQRILSFLPPNDIACTVRLINKATAAPFHAPEFKVVRLSQPCPEHAFAWQWSKPGAARAFTYKERRNLITLAIKSGSLPNLKVAVASAGLCRLSPDEMGIAASLGRLDMLQWLLQHGFPWGDALPGAASKGHVDMCEWLLDNGCPWDAAAMSSAARNGHLDVAEWLTKRRAAETGFSGTYHPKDWLCSVAAGCDLPTLIRCDSEHDGRWSGLHLMPPGVLSAAAGSRTPDWQAKVLWAEERGARRSEEACESAANCPDALDRLRWLWQRGYPLRSSRAAACAAKQGNIAVLEFLLQEGIRPGKRAAEFAAGAGRLEVLQWLQARGCLLKPQKLLPFAARAGHLPVMIWLVETLGAELNSALSCAWGPEQGSSEVLRWLRRRRRFSLGFICLRDVVLTGCEELLEVVAERGYPPMPADGSLYRAAGGQGDLAMLRCLRRLDCPWGDALFDCVYEGCPLPVLQWLLDAGCPVKWYEVMETIRIAQERNKGPSFTPQVVAWVTEQWELWKQKHQALFGQQHEQQPGRQQDWHGGWMSGGYS
ncbi:hypothetical protein Agub_g3564 [Astrephomene gubernaculifera]|uniref:Ankyrin repeat domain-containing protein n=1 Tax=Astrephomene gubernaculifera TaxID=47775 RepID=A0AAD3DJE8_9CHLO|nr:hypothetical protein Agub_g3564 [Astrephomene gubernaculifera]